jgi:hypothetical protein
MRMLHEEGHMKMLHEEGHMRMLHEEGHMRMLHEEGHMRVTCVSALSMELEQLLLVCAKQEYIGFGL